MPKKALTLVSIVSLFFLASCSTDNMPTESTGSASKNTSFTAKENSTSIKTESNIQHDTIQTSIQVLNSTARTLENGDLGALKDKKK